MTDSTILIEIKSDGQGARVIKRDLDDIAKKSDVAVGKNDKFNASLKRTDTLARSLKTAFAGFIATLALGSISGITDEFKLLSSRLEQSTRNTQEFEKSLTGLLAVSRETGSSLADAVAVFQRLSFVRDEISATTDEMVAFTGTVQKLGIVSGASSGALSAGLTQLGQGLSSGILRAEEFNSIVENIPAVAKAISEEFGVTTGELRQLVLQGEVLSEDVFTAIIKQTETTNKQFDKMPLTIGRAFAQLKQDLGVAVSGIDDASGASNVFALGISKLGDISLAIGNTFKAVFSFVEGTIAGVAETIFAILENVLKSVNFVIRALNKIPKVNILEVSLEEDFAKARNLASIIRKESLASGLGSISAAGGNIADIFTGRDDEVKETEKTTRTISKNYSDIADAIKEGNEGNKDSNAILGNTKTLTQDISDALTETASNFGDSIIDAFQRGFEGGEGFIGDFKDSVSSAFNSLLSNIGSSISSIIFNSAGGSTTGGTFQSDGSSGFGFSGVSQLLSIGKTALTSGLSSQLFSAGSTIGKGINAFGSATGLTNSAFIGPSLPGASNLASSFTPGTALAGFGGNLGANLLFGDDRGIGASIGGTVGSIAGTAIGGPIGAAIGGFLGNAVGGLFGNSEPSDKRQLRSIDFDTLAVDDAGSFTGSKFSQANSDFADEVANQITGISTLLKNAGAELEGAIDIRVGSRDGLFVNGVSKKEDFGDAISDAILGSISDAPEDLLTVIDNISSVDDLPEALGILDLVRAFEDLGEVTRPLGDLLETLDSQFEELAGKATDLGLPIDALTDSYDAQREALIDDYLSPLQSFLDNQALSGDSSLNDGQRLSLARSAFDENISAIQLGDFSNINDITSQASALLDIGRDVFASGEGFAALESFVRQSVTGIAGDLGAEGGLDDSIAREISLSNAQSISIQEQILVELQETRLENTRLRKAMERVGNQVAVSA